jgi:hypothetical protein
VLVRIPYATAFENAAQVQLPDKYKQSATELKLHRSQTLDFCSGAGGR